MKIVALPDVYSDPSTLLEIGDTLAWTDLVNYQAMPTNGMPILSKAEGMIEPLAPPVFSYVDQGFWQYLRLHLC